MEDRKRERRGDRRDGAGIEREDLMTRSFGDLSEEHSLYEIQMYSEIEP